jgi:predicted PurR-regulated permease PerM
MHPLTVIIAVMAGTTLMGGIVGGILAIPITAVLRAIMFRYVWGALPVESSHGARCSLGRPAEQRRFPAAPPVT